MGAFVTYLPSARSDPSLGYSRQISLPSTTQHGVEPSSRARTLIRSCSWSTS